MPCFDGILALTRVRMCVVVPALVMAWCLVVETACFSGGMRV
jgi:hypothetical protein